MFYDVQLNLPAPWQTESENYQDESGAEITHIESHLYNDKQQRDESVIDVYVGPMPEDMTAEDQAFSNYADMVGFEESDPDDFNPILKLKFNGKNAYGFEACYEDESPMMFLSQEIRSGVLAIICAGARDNAQLSEVIKLLEKTLRVKSDNK